jgi:hypothetical protein
MIRYSAHYSASYSRAQKERYLVKLPLHRTFPSAILKNIEYASFASSFPRTKTFSSSRSSCISDIDFGKAQCIEIESFIDLINQEISSLKKEEAFFKVMCDPELLKIITQFQGGVAYRDWTSGDKIAENGHLSLLKEKIKCNQPLTFTTAAMDLAAKNGHLQVVQWLHGNRQEGCSKFAMEYAAVNGHLQVVQWLHENRREGCTPYTFGKVAAKGNIEMLKWLHFNMGGRCFLHAMDWAAANGHLEVIQWLHDNRVERCTSVGMNLAASNGHFLVVQYLFEHYPQLGTAFTMEKARACGHDQIANYLQNANH